MRPLAQSRVKPLDQFWRVISQNTRCPIKLKFEAQPRSEFRNTKLGHKGALPIIELWGLPLSQERLKIETSNFACGLMVRDAKQKNKKLAKGDVALVT